MSEQQALEVKDKGTSFIPFGGQDEITLTINMVMSIIAVPTKSKKYPTKSDCIKFIALCKARRLNPFEGDAFLTGYDSKDGPKFSLITAHQAFLKRAEANEQFDGMKSGIIVKRDGQIMDVEGDFHFEGDEVLGGWASVYRKDRKVPMTKRLALRQRKPGYENQFWSKDKMGEQICKCAEADALRASFPTVIGGLYIKEEIEKNNAEVTAPASEPIFAGAIEMETEKVEEEPPPITIDAASLRALCKRDGITEEVLIEFADAIALCDKSKIKSVDKLSQSSIATLIGQWDEFSNKIKEEMGA